MKFLPIKIENNNIFIYQFISKKLKKSLEKENIELKMNKENIAYVKYNNSSLLKLQNLLSNEKDELIDSLLYKNRTIPYL